MTNAPKKFAALPSETPSRIRTRHRELILAGLVLVAACEGRRARPGVDAGPAGEDTGMAVDAGAADAPRATPDSPPAGPSSLAIVGGDRQLVLSENPAMAPLTVRALDGHGRPARGARITFTVLSGMIRLAEASATTDGRGEASVAVTGGFVTGSSWVPGTVEARWDEGPAAAIFHVTTTYYDRLTRYAPAAVLEEPASRSFGVVHSGDVVADLLRLRVTHTDGPDAHMPIPGIGLRVQADDGETMTVACDSNGISDLEGLIGCDVSFIGPPGPHRFSVVIGELIFFHGMTVHIDPSSEAP